MRRWARAVLASLAAACGGDAPAEPPSGYPELPPASAGALELGRAYTGAFYAGAADALWPRLSGDLRRVFGSPAGLRAFRERVRADAGAETAVLDERTIRLAGAQLYARRASFDRSSTAILVRWTIDPAGTAAGFSIAPEVAAAASRFLDYQTRTPLRLPVAGDWFVGWGGRDVVDNYHAVVPDQRFATDLVVVRGTSTHAGSGTANADYYCFGEPILAPGEGTVAAAVDGIADNLPGALNAVQALGNHVVIDHGNGEFSFLAHLQAGSVTVRPGERVPVGHPLGRCGNSGNSSEPHLHYHLQTTPTFGAGEGLPAQFTDYLADGVPIARGEPRRGETVRAR